jgi:hypothetical protein
VRTNTPAVSRTTVVAIILKGCNTEALLFKPATGVRLEKDQDVEGLRDVSKKMSK